MQEENKESLKSQHILKLNYLPIPKQFQHFEFLMSIYKFLLGINMRKYVYKLYI